MKSVRLILTTALLATLALGVTGAGQSAERPLVQVKYSTAFGSFGREAYAWVALEKGYFREAGFDVTITPGNGTVGVATLLTSGQVDFGAGDTTGMVLARANQGIPVKCVTLIQQNTLSGFIALRESGINSFKDFEGKTIADTPGATSSILFPLYAKRAGIDASKVQFVPSTAGALPTLLASKRVDIVGQFTVGIPLFQNAAGGKPVVSFPAAKLVKGLMGNCLMVSDDRIASKPDEVRRFAHALLRGLKYSIDNPGDAGRILNKHVPLADPVIAAKELRIMKKYVQTPDVVKNGYGYVDAKRFDSTVSIINNFFKPSKKLRSADVYAPGFAPRPTIRVK